MTDEETRREDLGERLRRAIEDNDRLRRERDKARVELDSVKAERDKQFEELVLLKEKQARVRNVVLALTVDAATLRELVD